jgi:hypothetical protein
LGGSGRGDIQLSVISQHSRFISLTPPHRIRDPGIIEGSWQQALKKSMHKLDSEEISETGQGEDTQFFKGGFCVSIVF